MTPEQAAERAAYSPDRADAMTAFPEQAAALVQVADGWTRLHTALADAPKDIEPGQIEPEPAPLGYVIVQSEGDHHELCVHGPDPLERTPYRLRSVVEKSVAPIGSQYVLCKLVPII